MTQIITVPHPLLRQKSKPVTKIDRKILNLIANLQKTLKEAQDPPGVGLSSVQIGFPLRIFLARKTIKSKPIIFINPEIVWKSKEVTAGVPAINRKQTTSRKQSTSEVKSANTSEVKSLKSGQPFRPEGCLSVPGYYGLVHRHLSIKIKYSVLKKQSTSEVKSADTSEVNFTFSGFLSTIIQHEMDHLDGKLFIDRVLEQKGKLYRLENNEYVETKL